MEIGPSVFAKTSLLGRFCQDMSTHTQDEPHQRKHTLGYPSVNMLAMTPYHVMDTRGDLKGSERVGIKGIKGKKK